MKYFFLLIFFITCFSLVAQPTAMFEATLYFEDAIGNVDSVIVGYDTLATTDIDSEFGEVEITAPFDSIFEVRVGTYIDWIYKDKLSKKIIEPAEHIPSIINEDNCFSSTHNFIYVWAKYQPVKVSWNSEQFMESICDRGSVITNHWTDELASPYVWGENPDELFYCMSVDTGLIIDLSAEVIINSNIDAPIFIEKEVEGLGEQTIYGIRFFPSATFTYTPCDWIVSDIKETYKDAVSLHISPNPATESVVIQLPDEIRIRHWEIYDTQGRLISFGEQLPPGFSIALWDAGLYFIKAKAYDGTLYTAKWMKQ